MLEIVGIIAGIVAAASIVLFGSRGLMDLVRGVSNRRKRGNDESSTIHEPVSAVARQEIASNITERPPTLGEDIRLSRLVPHLLEGNGNWGC